MNPQHNAATTPLFEQVLQMIQDARSRIYTRANSELIILYWNVGAIVAEKIKTAAWGQGTVDALASYIQKRQPGLNGFTRRGLYRMKQFYETYSQPELIAVFEPHIRLLPSFVTPGASQTSDTDVTTSLIVTPGASQLQNTENQLILTILLVKISWSHHLEILTGAKTAEEKLFYLLLTIKDRLKKTELRRHIQTGAFERVMLANTQLQAATSPLPDGFFKDPYIFEFLQLPEVHSETDLEKALVSNLQNFIIELGAGFTYMGRQFTLQVGNKDYRTDLLFYHRDLACLVLFELKIGEFEPEFLGKLNFYLEALDRDVKRPHEKPSIGVLLCKGKDTEVVEYAMARNTSPALIAEYETHLIDKKLLAAKLHQLAEQLSRPEEQ